jgi:hypothetical protein
MQLFKEKVEIQIKQEQEQLMKMNQVVTQQPRMDFSEERSPTILNKTSSSGLG